MSASYSIAIDDNPSSSLRIFYGAVLLSLVVHVVAGLWLLNFKSAPLPTPPKPLEVQIQPPRIPPVIEVPPLPQPVQKIIPLRVPPKTIVPKKIEPNISRPQPMPTPVLSTQQPSETPVVAPPVAVSIPEPRKAPPREEPLTAPVSDAAYLNNPRPPYPPMARKMGIQGTVILRVMVDASGKPQKVTVYKDSGSAVLNDSAVETVLKSWTFVPAHRGEVNVAGEVDVPIRFGLSN